MDFLVLSPELAPRLVDTGIDASYRGREGASDHAPVWVVLGPG
jgi:exodeoxyribonuclease-3